MTSEEAFERYLKANAKEKEAWQAYLDACTVTRKASEEHDRISLAGLQTTTSTQHQENERRNS